MIAVSIRQDADLAGFRTAVRRLAAAGIPPEQVAWTTTPTLFDAAPEAEALPVSLPKALASLVPTVLCHRDPERHGLLYAAIWRVMRGERALLEVASDPLVHRLDRMAKAVRRDIHKMHAFVRFRQVSDVVPDRFVAWFEPEHLILRAAAPFFVDRFQSMRWAILTPIGSLEWDGTRLAEGPPGRREDGPAADPFEAGWRGYYESTFNPSRVNPAQMRAEMPKRYWRNLPEAAAISALVRGAAAEAKAMQERGASVPRHRTPDRAVAAMADQVPTSLEALNRLIAGRRRWSRAAPAPFWARARSAQRLPSSASSRATRRTCRAIRSSAPPVRSSTGRWWRPGSTAGKPTSPMRSSISSMSSAASGGSTSARPPAR